MHVLRQRRTGAPESNICSYLWQPGATERISRADALGDRAQSLYGRCMAIDSFKWLPPSLRGFYENMHVPPPDGVPWSPLAKPLREARIALVTTAGLNVRGLEPPFDYEREQREPRWGDPSYRRLPRDVRQEQVQTGHLHINNEDIDRDFNVAIPITRMLELEAQGVVGSLASTNYSFMGYQPDTAEWSARYGPEVARLMKDDAVDGVVMTPV